MHTGWMEASAGGAGCLYAPHTEAAYRLPHSKTLYRFAAGYITRRDCGAASAKG